MKRLSDLADVVRVLTPEVIMELTGANSKQFWNWTGRYERFPANTYVILMRALNRRGYTAPARIWNMKGVTEEEEAA